MRYIASIRIDQYWRGELYGSPGYGEFTFSANDGDDLKEVAQQEATNHYHRASGEYESIPTVTQIQGKAGYA